MKTVCLHGSWGRYEPNFLFPLALALGLGNAKVNLALGIDFRVSKYNKQIKTVTRGGCI